MYLHIAKNRCDCGYIKTASINECSLCRMKKEEQIQEIRKQLDFLKQKKKSKQVS